MIKNIKYKKYLLILCTVFIASCTLQKLRSGRYAVHKITHKHKLQHDPEYPINDQIRSSTAEEAFFLEDVDFTLSRDKNGKIRARGRKLFTRNKVTYDIFPFDKINLMQQRGECRAKLIHLKADLDDDGVINNSNKKDYCMNNSALEFSKGSIDFKEVSFLDLEDWNGDDFKDALISFLSSCNSFATGRAVQSKTFAIGTPEDWNAICSVGKKYFDSNLHKAFFERYFSPFAISDNRKNNGDIGLFTGYYIWELPVSLKRTTKYPYPIYGMPPECKINPGCYSRAQINAGALQGRGLEIAWTANIMDVYFMQIQGSGLGITESGQEVRFNYAGKNNMAFKSFTQYFNENPGICPFKDYPNAANWLYANPDAAVEATNYSSSYVFFQISNNNLVYGAQGIPLSQSRSVAVDPEFIPYGLPIWIETNIPIIDIDQTDKDQIWTDFNRLWIAQDTGGAIKGVVRGDLYFGHGRKGEFIAKNMKFPGKWFALIPNALIQKIQ